MPVVSLFYVNMLNAMKKHFHYEERKVACRKFEDVTLAEQIDCVYVIYVIDLMDNFVVIF